MPTDNIVIDRPPQRAEVPDHLPGGSTVVILNDPITPAGVVVEAIVYGTGLPESEALQRMLRAHRGGWAPIASYASRDVAESVAAKIQIHARQNTSYDALRPLIKFHGPWPLCVEVNDAN